MATSGDAHTTLRFLGAARTVTGSKYLLSSGDRRILIDVGLFQGEKALRKRNWSEFPFDPASITDVLITHAHMDHVGLLPRLVQQGFRGPIFATEGTVRLAEIVLRDGAKIQEQDAVDANRGGWSKHRPALPLYSTADVLQTLPLFVPIPYDEDLDLDDGIVARYTRAGHILGSASITLWTPTASVVFSGDLGRDDHPVLRRRETPPGASIALIESTYGDRTHPSPDLLPHEGFADVIRRTIERRGSVLVPAFAVDRTEVVIAAIAEMRRHGRIPMTPIYVNSPMANLALDEYRDMPGELRDDLAPDDLLEVPGLRSIRSLEESIELTAGNHPPSIIIAASGMATGGRVLHHLETMLPDPKHAVVLTGYQAAGTRGRQLADGATKLKLLGQYLAVRAEVYQDHEFSVHAAADELIAWLRELSPRPSTVFCVHGELDPATALAERIERELPSIDAIVPRHEELVILDGRHAAPRPAEATPVRIERDAIPDALGSPFAPAAVGGSRAGRTGSVGAGGVRGAVGAVGTAEVGRPAPAAYRLITAATPDDLSREVTAALEQGFLPYGDPGVGAVDGAAVFLQALTRSR